MTAPAVAVVLDAHLAGHVAVAMRRHEVDLRRHREPVPDGFAELLDALLATAQRSGAVISGQGRSILDGPDESADAALVTVPQAAAELELSVSTVRRRIADGTIASVAIGGARRIPRTEITRLTGA